MSISTPSPESRLINDLSHVSEKEWSAYSAADYTIEQWHNACLIHQHTGPPTSKNQCKLPVKTPNGAVNRNGVHAALAALHGARTPINASSQEKARAESRLRTLYSQMGEKFQSASHSNEEVDKILEHYGKKGMKWGVRTAKTPVKTSKDYKKSVPLRNRKTRELSNKQIQNVNARITLEQNYRRLNPTTIEKGNRLVKGLLTLGTTAAAFYTLANSPAGKAAIAQGKKLLSKTGVG